MAIQTDDFAPAPSKRIVSAAPSTPQEEAIERALRPKLFDDYVGQATTREQLEIFIGAAKMRLGSAKGPMCMAAGGERSAGALLQKEAAV